MHPLIYDVAVSIDGLIAGPDGDISRFPTDGPVVEDYRARLASYTTAIMGGETYRFGYRFGLTPGENPYPHMQSHVFSRSLTLPRTRAVTLIPEATPDLIRALKQRGPVYLCGGGAFAGWLLGQG